MLLFIFSSFICVHLKWGFGRRWMDLQALGEILYQSLQFRKTTERQTRVLTNQEVSLLQTGHKA